MTQENPNKLNREEEAEKARIARAERIKKKIEFSEEKIEYTVLTSFREIDSGIELDKELLSRLKLIERYSEINTYSRMVSVGTGNILDGSVSSDKLLRAKIAALIHDVGKAGPVSATPEQQLSVVRLFAAEELKNPQQNVFDAVKTVFGEETEKIISDLKNCGITSSMTMRDFWDKHIVWGSEVNRQYSERSKGISPESIMIAGLHHAYKDPDNPKYNPQKISVDEETLKRAFTAGILEEFLSIVVSDNYEAFSVRSAEVHEEAVKKVKGAIKSKQFCSNHSDICKLIDNILAKISEMGPGEIFKGSKEII